MPSLTGQNIIDLFEQDTGDTTELSSVAELQLANKIYRDVLSDRDWEFLKKAATGTITVTSGVATITPPADFDHLAINAQATDIAIGVDGGSFGIGNASPKVIYVSVSTGVYIPFQIVNFSDRRQYVNKNGYAYLDTVNNLITFTVAPTATDLTYEFDYIYVPADITVSTSPVFPSQFHDVIHHGMAVDDMIFQLFDRAKSYAAENKIAYNNWLTKLRFWNSQLINN